MGKVTNIGPNNNGFKMSVYPECHSPYVAGGVTRSQIKYDTTNPYENNRKSLEEGFVKGMNINYAI